MNTAFGSLALELGALRPLADEELAVRHSALLEKLEDLLNETEIFSATSRLMKATTSSSPNPWRAAIRATVDRD